MPKRALTAAAVDRLKPPATRPGRALRRGLSRPRPAHQLRRRPVLGLLLPGARQAAPPDARHLSRHVARRGSGGVARGAGGRRAGRRPRGSEGRGEAPGAGHGAERRRGVHHEVREAAQPDRRRGGAHVRAAPLPRARASADRDRHPPGHPRPARRHRGEGLGRAGQPRARQRQAAVLVGGRARHHRSLAGGEREGAGAGTARGTAC